MKKGSNDLLLGAHMSIAGGLDRAAERGRSIGCNTIQIFTKSNNQWRAKPLTDEQVERFHQSQDESGIAPIIAHDCYLINLASPDREKYQKSFRAFLEEMQRAERLGLPYLVMHPGAHLGSGESRGLRKIALALNRLHQKTPGYRLIVLLETTAGQGTGLGYRFEHLAEIIEGVEQPERLGVCFDTCHVFAAGYDIRTPTGYREVMQEFDRTIGLERLQVFHLNDSKKPLGSRVDRHEHIGKGHIGLETFRMILQDQRFRNVPKILETPKGRDLAEDRMNLKRLRQLARKNMTEAKRR